MNSSSCLRSVIRASVCVALWLAVPAGFGATPDRHQAQAQLLDHAELNCADCFFGPGNHYYCFAADSLVLIGYQRTPVLNFQDQSKNYLPKVHPSWADWNPPGQTVPISYDDKYIWVSRPESKPAKQDFWAHLRAFAFWASRGDSKQVRLKRSATGEIFTHNNRCRDAGAAQAHQPAPSGQGQ